MLDAVLLADPPVTDVTDYFARGGGTGFQRALGLGPGGTIQEVILSGLRGRGGGGYPTGRKWQSVRGAAADAGDQADEENRTFVVCNGAEGEPATFKDRAIIRASPHSIVEGVAIAAFAIGAERAFIAVKERFEPEIERLAAAVDELTSAGAIGDVSVQVVLGPDAYLYGEETGLLQVIEGEAPMPRNVPPYIHGLFATVPTTGWSASPAGVVDTLPSSNPTLVNNVETLATVTHVLARGPEWHRAHGTAESAGRIVATVVGDVVRPGVGEIEMGTPLGEVIDRVGGGVAPGRRVKAVLSGVANPVLTGDQLDTPCSYEGMAAVGSGLGAAGFLVLDDTTSMVEVAQLVSRFLYVESCGQCPACKLGCGAVTERLDLLARGEATPDDLDTIAYRLRTVTDGNRCYLPVQEQRVISSLLQTFPGDVAAALGGQPPAGRGLDVPKLVDLADGRATYDERQSHKRADWTYDDDS
ncbi:MAG: NADH-ubiquinone oxidoreductase-F iron-sulfur binding region domain-containing protein [Acidimicrobiales bacterium]